VYSLAGKVAVVTGAGRSRGLGFAIARRLADEGAVVVLSDLPQLMPELAESVQMVAATGRQALAAACDVTAAADVEIMFQGVVDRFGRLDILVNNAGVIVTKLVVDTTDDDWERCVQVIGKGTFLCSRHAVRRMIDQGQGGRIINISSISGKEGNPYWGAYTFAKFGVVGFTQTLAREVARYGITVNAVCPGVVETDMNDQLRADLAVFRGAASGGTPIPLGRTAQPGEVAGLVAFLASSEAAYMTGQAINFDGGMVTH
jgi:meso-butanediol dehydrogenase/(S,S)-butanediol dehydrogenase/diacetyl reductase